MPLRELHLLFVPNTKWETISINFTMEFSESIEFDAVIIVVNLVSKTAHFFLTHTTIIIEDTTKLFLYHILKLYSLLI